MTSTPERWDDVGSLRVQLDYISLQVHDVQKEQAGLEVAQLRAVTEKLEAVVHKQQKDMCHMKICIVATVIAIFLYVHLVSLNATSAISNSSLDQQSISTEGIGGELPQQTLLDHVAPTKVANFDAELDIVASAVARDSSGVQKALEDDIAKAQALSYSSPSSPQERHTGEESKSVVGDERDDGTVMTKSKDNDDGNIETEAFQLPVAALPQQTISSRIQLMEPVAFQELKSNVLSKRLRGTFWVCFPPQQLVDNVSRYSSVFNAVANKWRQYAFVFLDTRMLKEIHDDVHLCAHGNTTYVLEQDNFAFQDQEQHVTMLGQKFRKVLDPNSSIEINLVNNFLEDVHAGKINEYLFDLAQDDTYLESLTRELDLIDNVLEDIKAGKMTEYTLPKGDLRL